MPKFILIIVLLVNTTAWAKPRAYFDVENSFWAGDAHIVIDGKVFSQGFFRGYKGLDIAMASDPIAQELASESQIYRNWGNGLLWGGLGASLIYSFSTTRENYSPGIYWGVFLGGFLPGVFFLHASNAKLIRAINQYNGVYSDGSTLRLSPTLNGFNLSYTF